MSDNPKHLSDAEADCQPPSKPTAQAEASAVLEQNTTESSEVPQSNESESKQDPSSDQRRHATSLLYETPIEEAPPPPVYSESYGLVDMSQLGLNTRANVANDGRLDITIEQKSRRLSNLLVPALRSQLHLQNAHEAPGLPPGYVPQAVSGIPGKSPPPPMNIVIHVVGSRGDVQPFVALGKVLMATFGHRVRLATHPVFRSFIEENNLEFFSIGGDPAELMAFMVKNPGLMPGKDALRSGDIGRRRKGMHEIIRGCWRSCFEAGDGTGVEISDSNMQYQADNDGGAMMEADEKPFVADAIIANPPSFAHIHCAEKLGVPLHLMFTMPWSPTQAFPHPLTNIQSSNADVSMTNFITYALVEMMTWQGLGDIINQFRETSLGLEPLSMMWAPGMISRLRIPHTYCWSPALIPKPKDWGPHIAVSGFYFLSSADNYTPPADLSAFLEAGPPPIYIGFGSIVVDDSNALTKLIFEAVKATGQRALVSKGWGGLGTGALHLSDDIFMLENVPHDWLFKHVSCVVHHGGAGTTAAGIALGKPTVIVPFFGDQPFWGAMVAKAGAGPLPIPFKHLTSAKLATAINEALKPSALQSAQELGQRIAQEKGSDAGAQTFHTALRTDMLRCSLAPSRVAVWRVKRTEIRLSTFAAAVLGNEGLLDFNELKLYRPREYDSDDGPWEPISGGASALLGTLGSLMMGVADFPLEIFKAFASKSLEERRTETDTAKLLSPRIKPATSQQSETASTIATSRCYSQSSSNISNQQEGCSISPDDHDPCGLTLHHVISPLVSDQWSNDSQAKLETQPHNSETVAADGESNSAQPPMLEQARTSTSKHLHRQNSGQNPQISFDTAIGAGKGVSRIISAGLKSPMDFTLGLARGFHNAPKLYGDRSVRQADKITGFQSGLRAAGKEFGYGFYDGISGLVMQPLEGVKKEGIAGLLKGFGKGIGGVVLKPGAAVWGVPGYTFKGIYKELQKHLGSSVQNYIIAARTAQGYEDWKNSHQEERIDVVTRWHAAQDELGKQKRQWANRRARSPQPRLPEKHTSNAWRPQKLDRKVKARAEEKSPSTPEFTRSVSDQIPSTSLKSSGIPSNDDNIEGAVGKPVAATSRRNAEEDAIIARAVKASVLDFQQPSKQGDDYDAYKRAIQTSITEAARTRPRRNGTQDQELSTSYKHAAELEAALHKSTYGHDGVGEPQRYQLSHDWDDSGVETDDDENIKFALEQSKQSIHLRPSKEDEALQRAIQQSQDDHQKEEQAKSAACLEEEIVLGYIKKQSLAEEEHRKSLAAKSSDK